MGPGFSGETAKPSFKDSGWLSWPCLGLFFLDAHVLLEVLCRRGFAGGPGTMGARKMRSYSYPAQALPEKAH